MTTLFNCNTKASVEWNLATIGGLVIAALVGMLLLTMVGIYLHPERLESTILAKNVALDIEALHATPFDVTYQHATPLASRQVILKDNTIKVTALDDASLSQKQQERLVSFHTYSFLTSSDVILPSEAIINAQSVVLDKQQNSFLLHDGTVSFDELLQTTIGLEEVKFFVVALTTGTDDAILESIKQGVIDTLAAQKFTLATSEQDATIIIQLRFSQETHHAVYYSTLNAQAVQLFATNTAKRLQALLDNVIIGGGERFTYSQATIDVAFGIKHVNFATLRDVTTRQLISQSVGTGAQETYTAALKQLN